jgi:hypothetical protein
MYVSNVGKPSVITAVFIDMKRLTLKRNPVNAMNVRKLSGVPTTFETTHTGYKPCLCKQCRKPLLTPVPFDTIRDSQWRETLWM